MCVRKPVSSDTSRAVASVRGANRCCSNRASLYFMRSVIEMVSRFNDPPKTPNTVSMLVTFVSDIKGGSNCPQTPAPEKNRPRPTPNRPHDTAHRKRGARDPTVALVLAAIIWQRTARLPRGGAKMLTCATAATPTSVTKDAQEQTDTRT